MNGGYIACGWYKSMIYGIMGHTENHRLICIKLGSIDLIKTQESS